MISEQERRYLEKDIGQVSSGTKDSQIPWRSILTSVSVWAVIVSGVSKSSIPVSAPTNAQLYYIFLQCLGDWAYFVAMIDLPKYLNDVLHLDAQSNGIYSSLPYLAYVMVSLISGYVSDRLIASGRLSVTHARKLNVILCKQLP